MTTRLMTIAAALVFACGCKTRITAEKNPEQMLPVYKVVQIAGTNTLYVADYARGSGGWHATAQSPLWAAEELRGLSIGVHTNGAVTLGLDAYQRDLSTNAVALTKIMCDAASDITAKVCAAIVSHGGSVAADGVSALVQKYIAKGGSAEKATVTCEGGNCTITDGAVTETCADCMIR